MKYVTNGTDVYEIPDEDLEQATSMGFTEIQPEAPQDAVARYRRELEQQQARREEPIGAVTAGARGITQGATLGWSDEAFAALGALAEKAGGAKESIPELYRMGVGEGRRQLAETQAQQPGAYMGGQLGGATLTGLAALPATTTIKGAAVAGGGLGAVGGAGAGQGPWETAKSAALGGLMGGVTGGAVQGVSDIASKVFSSAKHLLASGRKYSEGQLIKDIARRSQTEPGFMRKLTEEEVKEGLEREMKRQGVERFSDLKLSELISEQVQGPTASSIAKSATAGIVEAIKRPAEKALHGMLVGGVTGGIPGALIGGIGQGAIRGAGAQAAAKYGPRVFATAEDVTKDAARVISKFTPIISKAIKAGTPFATISNVLMQSSPEYRQAAQAIQDKARAEIEEEETRR